MQKVKKKARNISRKGWKFDEAICNKMLAFTCKLGVVRFQSQVYCHSGKWIDCLKCMACVCELGRLSIIFPLYMRFWTLWNFSDSLKACLETVIILFWHKTEKASMFLFFVWQEQMDMKVLQFQNKKLAERIEQRKRAEEELHKRIEQLENRQRTDDAVLMIVNRYWNQVCWIYPRPPDKSAYLKIIFLTSWPKHML